MKLSEMTTDQAANALIIVTPEIGAILEDGELLDRFRQKVVINKTDDEETIKQKKKDGIKNGIQIFVHAIPLLLGKYRQNIYKIIGAVNEKTAKQVAAQKMKQTIAEITEIFNDEDLLSFFQSSKASELTTASDISQNADQSPEKPTQAT